MPYILLSFATLFISFTGIGATFYNRKNGSFRDTPQIYNLITLAAVFSCWLVKFLTNPEYDIAVIPYSIIFTLGYTVAMVFSVYAYRDGPMMLSSLIMQLSMISTTVWGLLFWESEVTLEVITGLVFVIVALVLCLYNGKDNGGEHKKITARWILFISLYFIGNSAASTIQRTEQIDFDSSYGDFFMVIATLISFIACLIVYLQSDRSDTKKILRTSWYLPIFVGIFNFATNLLIITIATLISANIVYPVLMIGSLVITSIFSIFVFKEKMRWWQWIGVAVGVVAIVFLSL